MAETEVPKYQLEDILNKAKAPPQILDLQGVKISTEEEYRKIMEKIPEYKVKPEKLSDIEAELKYEVRGYELTRYPEEITQNINNKNGPGLVHEKEEYRFADPCPPSMREVRISDLSSVDINWKMLTLSRPKSKIEENIFSKERKSIKDLLFR
ncbi:uncharacterized protein LOC111718358 isoform X2 [Eurytemora carolleeae]|uniref:uncharacterized protein LOC111718358 isoform X2 n=1 Tax=Eurytemora carolleeae TaxID=1294199 RepID=UPI000C788027|nr:uncharacterized protein LOC111718358 isoform X2 [Eurytemora carolleeae]|eukprot:XP_023349694.1 uncharacterized protein LOC111718358 isoform X2 [Eurytemora affinis]